jgi:apolipoprotein N-acyltransferase
MDFVRKHPLLAAVVAVVSTAVLLSIGNGMNAVWPVMWVALLPVLVLAAETDSWRLAGVATVLGMLLGSLTMLYYLYGVLHAPVYAWLIPYSFASLLFALGVLLFRALLRRGAVFSAVVSLPALWTVGEYLSSFVPANGTAGSLAYTQLRFLPLLQLASLTGPWGISFLLLLFSTAIAAAFYLRRDSRARRMRVVVPVLVILAGVLAFGAVRLSAPGPSQTIKVGLLATDRVAVAPAGARMEELVRDYAEQAARLAQQGARIVVMPEKTGVLPARDAGTLDPLLQSVADGTGATLVIGVVHVAAPQQFNEARIYQPRLPIATYDKQHMLPGFESDQTPGRSLTLLAAPAGRVGVEICKDMDFIQPARDYGRAGVALMLDPAWDFNLDRAWHGHIAIMRGVENGYAIAHTAKNGFLTVTDSRGRILGEERSGGASFASLLVDVPVRHEDTIFNRYGAWFPWVAGVLLLGALVRLVIVLRFATSGEPRGSR